MLCTDIIKSKISGSSSGGGGTPLLELTTTFKADGETVYIASCNGDSYISLPPEPTSTSGSFVGWENEDGEIVTFPYFPIDNDTLEAKFSQLADMLYTKYNISKTTCPYIVVTFGTFNQVWFCQNAKQGDNSILISPIGRVMYSGVTFTDINNPDTTIAEMVNSSATYEAYSLTDYAVGNTAGRVVYSNKNFNTLSTLYMI